MATADSEDILHALEESADRLVDAIRDVSDEDAHVRPVSDGWSVLDNVEHLVLVEDVYQKRLSAGRSAGTAVFDSHRAAGMMSDVKGRATAVKAPPTVLPTGRYGTLRDAIAAFADSRKRTADLVRSRAGELASLAVPHPRFGDMSGAEACYLLASHTLRHVAQITDVKRSISTR